MSRDFDAEIAAQEAELETLKPQMADALTAFLDVTAPWAAEFWKHVVAQAVTENPEAVKALGEDGRKSVKAEAQQFIENARVFIQRRLVDERQEAWPHLKPQTEPDEEAFRGSGGPGSAYGARSFVAGIKNKRHIIKPSAVEGPLNGVLGDLAEVLTPHGFKLQGFKRSDYGRGWYVDRWDKKEWSDEMIERSGAYGDLHDRYVEALRTIGKLRAEKERTEAADLWEGA